jgi:hypothetical protein
MSSLEEMEMLYTSNEAPIVPTNGFAAPKRSSNGWVFYQQTRSKLAEWWEEFNGDLDHHARLKHTSVRSFIKTKTRNTREQNYLYQMIGPVSKREEGCDLPYLGDWDKRRRCGFGVLDQPEKIKPLIKAIQSNIAAAESIKSMTPLLVEELVQYSSLQKQVHEAYANRAFLSGKSADDKKNHARFNSYRAMLWALSELKINIIHEIMRVHGVDPNLPQQMREMAQIAGGIGAAAALTGMAASQSGVLGVRSADGSMIAPFTYDSIKLAEHLTRHAHTFKKPLPITIDAEVAEEDSSSSSSKSNGKTQ